MTFTIMLASDLFYSRSWCKANIEVLQQKNYNLYHHRFKIENMNILQEMVLKIIIRCDRDERFTFIRGVRSETYLVRVKICKSPEDGLFEHDEARTFNRKTVSVGSKCCYALHFANHVLNPIMPIQDGFSFAKYIILKQIQINTAPNFNAAGESDPYVIIVNTKVEILCELFTTLSVKPQRPKMKSWY